MHEWLYVAVFPCFLLQEHVQLWSGVTPISDIQVKWDTSLAMVKTVQSIAATDGYSRSSHTIKVTVSESQHVDDSTLLQV